MTHIDKVAMLLQDALNIDLRSQDVDLFESGLIDSAMFIELLMLLEDEFSIKVSLDELEPQNFGTIGRIADFVRSKLEEVAL
ncbi:MAG: acyl carrier protein [Methylotetracoccus sp.]|jgi:acyl carrier protein|nr:acyl carrier protein [Methylotetracoccus sp.]